MTSHAICDNCTISNWVTGNGVNIKGWTECSKLCGSAFVLLIHCLHIIHIHQYFTDTWYWMNSYSCSWPEAIFKLVSKDKIILDILKYKESRGIFKVAVTLRVRGVVSHMWTVPPACVGDSNITSSLFSKRISEMLAQATLHWHVHYPIILTSYNCT